MQLGIAETKENQVGVENKKFSAKTLYLFKVFIINSISVLVLKDIGIFRRQADPAWPGGIVILVF